MLPKVLELVAQTAQQIDTVIKEEISFRSNVFQKVRVGAWRDDPTLKIIISDFKKQCQIVSQSFVKLALLINPKTNFEDNIMKSIFDEVIQQLQTLTNIYWRCLECSLGVCLFDYFSQAMRSLLDQIQQLLQILPTKDKPSINYMTGMITKSVETIDKIPVVNKAAYRRFILEKTLAAKETMEEFDGYLQSALANGVGNLSVEQTKDKSEEADEEDDEDDDDDDEEEDEQEYSHEEFKVVEKHVTVFRTAIDLFKLSLAVITEVGDRINDETNSNSAEEAKKRKELQGESDLWIAKVVRQVGVVEGAILDSGAELYPPIHSEDAHFQEMSRTLIQQLQQLSSLLIESSQLLEFLSAEKVASLRQYHTTIQSFAI